MKKHMIWTNSPSYINEEEYINDLRMEEEYKDMDEDDLMDIMWDCIGDNLDDERANLNIQLHDDIVVIGDLGLWNGRYDGYKLIESGNISDCLYSSTDYSTWYVDENGDLRCEGVHHDGTNEYLYRVWKKGISESQKENFLAKIYRGEAKRRDITRYTERLGDYIGSVYGWEFSRNALKRSI
jgi:hypothetical protein